MRIGDYLGASQKLLEKYASIPSPKQPGTLKDFVLPTSMGELSDGELGDWLLQLGAWKGWLGVQLANIDSQLSIMEDAYNLRLGSGMAKLESASSKKILKEGIRAMAIEQDEELGRLDLDVSILRAEKQLLKGRFELFDNLFGTISRVITLRGQERMREV